MIIKQGRGGTVDMTRAVELFTRSCDAGLGSGCADLGDLYHEGVMVKLDEARALDLFEKGCKLESQRACRRLEDLRRTEAPR